MLVSRTLEMVEAPVARAPAEWLCDDGLYVRAQALAFQLEEQMHQSGAVARWRARQQ